MLRTCGKFLCRQKQINAQRESFRCCCGHGNTSVDELAAQLDASAASVRRDLTRLEQRGLVHRTHGGAKLAGQTLYEPFRFDSSFQVREGRFTEEKRRIGLAAAELIREHDTVGFTAGTTTTQVARCIRHRSPAFA